MKLRIPEGLQQDHLGTLYISTPQGRMDFTPAAKPWVFNLSHTFTLFEDRVTVAPCMSGCTVCNGRGA